MSCHVDLDNGAQQLYQADRDNEKAGITVFLSSILQLVEGVEELQFGAVT